uniref:Formylglycine-generating enzyme, required for sulfatase activity, contains SUMF1/FGE domain n=1 Tax=uncultured Thiotrichaceae bacterium TaxID=298394 RepID=A0A6S6UAP3_9GAMM|nr:MAG: Formylglycine-generating enzyme, required for sulfatase activity, contains SUMF1/FGE domain [uncultured Thiotrichaceae bacterium]
MAQTLTPYNHPDYDDLPPNFPPVAASAWGEDRYGIWFELNVNDIVQRFRWVPKGEFTMGESGDSLHEVKLSQGFWLADTTCTQELWQAVMGENPSSFKDSLQNPVDTVSWLDAQNFIQKLNQLVPELNAYLPSEAQWEYACRSGTTSPFSFGDNITTDQVNYDGNYPYAGGEKGEYREKTVEVKALPANQWGLYQMHGNVWEWCFDEYASDLGDEAVTDPVTARFKSGVKPDKTVTETENTGSTPDNTPLYDSTLLENGSEDGVLRVLRGGSWSYYGRNCRSAIRNGGTADLRIWDLGFRFAAGH